MGNAGASYSVWVTIDTLFVRDGRIAHMGIDTILLAIGENDEPIVEDLVETTTALADHGASVVVLHVATTDEYHDLAMDLDSDMADPEIAAEIAQRNDTCQEACDRLQENGIDPEIRGAVDDDSPRAVVSMAQQEGVDHIVIGGRNRSPTGKALFGDHAQHILLEASCPVTFIRHD